MKNKKNNKNKVSIISIISLVLILLIGGTVAYFGWTAEKESTINVTVSSGFGSCTLKEDNDVLLVPTSVKESGRIIKLNAKQEMADKAYIKWNLVINEINGLKDESFKYQLINSTTGQIYSGYVNGSLGSGNFKDLEAGSTITFENNRETLDYNTDYVFILYLWIDGENFKNDPNTMASQVFDFDVNCELTGTE